MDFLSAVTLLILLILLVSYLNVLYECIRYVKIHTIASYKSQLCSSAKSDDVQNSISIKQAPGPLPWPIIGNLNLLGQYENPFEAFTELAKIYGDIYSMTLGTTRCLVVNNLTLIREVLNQNGRFFGGRPDFIRYHKLFGGDRNNSLALCDWSNLQQRRRNLARKHCSPRSMSSFYQKMNNVGCFELQEFMQKLNEEAISEQEYYLKPVVMQTCMNMFSQYMCSVRFQHDDLEFQKAVHYFDEIFWEINQGYAVDFLPWLLPFYKGHMNKLVTWSSSIRKFILDRIINTREDQFGLEDPERDFTDALLKGLSEDANVSHDTLMFMLEDFIGGHSAVGNLVMIALAYVVRFPEVGQKIQAEVDSIAKTGKQIELSDSERMPYTIATIYEVLRHSSSPIVPHVATEDTFIAGHGVTKGTIVFINNYELNTSEKYWSTPEEFNPDRFLEVVPRSGMKVSRQLSESSDSGIENEEIEESSTPQQMIQVKKNIPHFLPFSIGKRTCIGQNLVKGFGFLMLAHILQSYDISSKDVKSMRTYKACVALPPDTFPLVLTRRRYP